MMMKTWTNPTIEELDIRLTAKVQDDGGKGDGKHCETHWSNGQGNGHSECGPGCESYDGEYPIYPEDPDAPLS